MTPAQGRHFRVQVLAPDYSGVIGTIPDYLSCSVSWIYLGVGSGTLTTRDVTKAETQLLTCRDQVVPVVAQAPGLPRWSGRVQNFQYERDAGQRGRIVATLVSDSAWLRSILAAPVPTAAWSAQTTAEYDVRSGPIHTVTKGYLQANIDRLTAEYATAGLGALPLAVVPAPGTDTTPTVRLEARNVPLQSLLVDSLRVAGLDLTATLWLPGDDQPPGLVLSEPTVVLDVVEGRDRPWVRFTDTAGAVSKLLLSGTHPAALGVVVLGPGEGTARTMLKVLATDGRVENLGRWAFPEEALEATDLPADVELTAAMTRRAEEKHLELSGTVAAAPTIEAGRPWVISPTGHAWVGDTVRARFSRVDISDRIERVTATDNRDGWLVTPQFGSARDTETPDTRLARTVAQVRADLARLQAGR